MISVYSVVTLGEDGERIDATFFEEWAANAYAEQYCVDDERYVLKHQILNAECRARFKAGQSKSVVQK